MKIGITNILSILSHIFNSQTKMKMFMKSLQKDYSRCFLALRWELYYERINNVKISAAVLQNFFVYCALIHTCQKSFWPIRDSVLGSYIIQFVNYVMTICKVFSQKKKAVWYEMYIKRKYVQILIFFNCRNELYLYLEIHRQNLFTNNFYISLYGLFTWFVSYNTNFPPFP